MTGETGIKVLSKHEGKVTISLMSDGSIGYSIQMKDTKGEDVVFNKTGCRQGGMSGKVKKALGFDQVKIN